MEKNENNLNFDNSSTLMIERNAGNRLINEKTK